MGNPVLGQNSFNTSSFDSSLNSHAMSIGGAIGKTCLLTLFMAITFAYTWQLQLAGFADKVGILSTVGAIGGLILALIITFAPKNRFLAITTTLYAMCEGLFLGSFSALVNSVYPGLASQAAIGTILTLVGMFVLYNTNIIKCDDKFKKVVFISTFAVLGIYVLQMILSLFHLPTMGIFSNSLVGIGFSIVVVAIAAFNLIVDFDFIKQYSGQVPDYFEWYGGFALLVTIVWLYIEILDLLMKLQSRK